MTGGNGTAAGLYLFDGLKRKIRLIFQLIAEIKKNFLEKYFKT